MGKKENVNTSKPQLTNLQDNSSANAKAKEELNAFVYIFDRSH